MKAIERHLARVGPTTLLFVAMALLTGLVFFMHVSFPFVSAEVAFTDTSLHGMEIVPASCPSNPGDGDAPYGCYGPMPLCPDGSIAPNYDVANCPTGSSSGGNSSSGGDSSSGGSSSSGSSSSGSSSSSGGGDSSSGSSSSSGGDSSGSSSGSSSSGGGDSGSGSSSSSSSGGDSSSGGSSGSSGGSSGGTSSGSSSGSSSGDACYPELVQNGLCVTSCGLGYIQIGNTCTFSHCPSGYVLHGDQCVLQCSPTYYCQNNTLYHRAENCAVTQTLSTCETDWTCSASAQACIPPSPQILSWKVIPTLVRQGDPTQVSWTTKYTTSCSITSTNGDSWTGLTGAQTSKPVNSRSTFSLLCQGFAGATPASVATSTIVNIIPVFQEK